MSRRLRDIITDMRSRFNDGLDPELVLDMAERLEGKEFTKQQRKKLSSMIENVSNNGGKMSDADKATLTSMLAVQEGMAAWLSVLMASEEDFNKLVAQIEAANGKAKEMADIKMDTLEGDVKTLVSAFEALQLEIFEGDAGNGLRAFTQGLTEDIRFVQNLLKDGFDIGDIGGMLAKVATQLKDKFLAFDGVGSVLAGGALVMGLKKIYDLTMRLKTAAVATKNWWQGAATTMNGGINPRTGGAIPPTATTGGVVSSVGTMNVNAGVVNVNGKVAGGANGTTNRGTAVTGSGTPNSNNTRGGTVIGGGTSGSRTSVPPVPPSASTSAVSRFAGVGTAAVSAGLFTAIFALMDTYTTRKSNEVQISDAQTTYKEAQKRYDETKRIYDAIAEDEERTAELPQAKLQLDTAAQDLQQASSDLKTIQKEVVKTNNESLFSGAGMVTGAMIGGGIGSVIPVAGTAIGAIAGAVLSMFGAYVGSEIGGEVSKNFDFDVLGWLKGDNDNKSSIERAVAQADWKTDSGKNYSELSSIEKIKYQREESAGERTRREEAQGAARNAAEHEAYGGASIGDFRKAESESIAEYKRQEELKEKNKYNDYTHAAAFNPQNVAVSNYDTEDARKVMAITGGKKYVSPEEARKSLVDSILSR